MTIEDELDQQFREERADAAMQTRCVYCLREQYASAVWRISHGNRPCVWCGKVSERMTDQQYREAMKAANTRVVR